AEGLLGVGPERLGEADIARDRVQVPHESRPEAALAIETSVCKVRVGIPEEERAVCALAVRDWADPEGLLHATGLGVVLVGCPVLTVGGDRVEGVVQEAGELVIRHPRTVRM